jgi:hypothetical protein
MVVEQKSPTRILAETAVAERRTFSSPDFPWEIIIGYIEAVVDHVPPIETPTVAQAKKIVKEAHLQIPDGYTIQDIMNSALTWINKVRSG